MEKQFHLKVGGRPVGVIYNLKQDWPHWIGDFEPNPEFEPIQNIFSKMADFKKRKCYQERDEQLMNLFKMGVLITAPDGVVAFKRTGEADLAGEIGMVSISNLRISFRIIGNADSTRGV